MSLLQKLLDEIEAEAAKKSAVAIAQAGTILELETLADTLRKNGATDFSVIPSIHTHLADITSPKSIDARIVVYRDHHAIINALLDEEMVFSTEAVTDNPYLEQRTRLRIMGTNAYIEFFDYNKPLTDGETE